MGILDNCVISPLINSELAATDDAIYASAADCNGLYAIDIASGELTFIGKFLHQGNFDASIFSVKRYGNNLIFAPGNAHEIAFFDLDKKQIEEVSMDGVFSTYSIVLSAFTVIDGILYMFPAQSNSIILYEISSKRVLKAINIADDYKNAFGEDYHALCATDSSYVYENKIYIPCWMTPAFMSLDLESHAFEFYKIPEQQQGFCSLFGQGDIIYALGRDGILIKWDIGLKKVISRLETLSGEKDAEVYRRITAIGGNIFLLSERKTFRPIKIEEDKHAGRLRQKYLYVMGDGDTGEKIYTGCLDGEKLYCHTDKRRYLCYDMKNERLEWVRNIKFDSDELIKVIFDETGVIRKNEIISETKLFGIRELIEISRGKHETEKQEEINMGEKIYHAVLQF